jgi:hypothetical protein
MTPDNTTTFGLVNPPTPVYQDDFSPAKGNALQACVASLFGQSLLSKVPNFISLDCGYEQGIRDYVQTHSKGTMALTKHKAMSNGDNINVGKLCVLRGKSPRGDFGHVVVARILETVSNNKQDDRTPFEMIHDPHPDATFLCQSESYGWFMTFDPVS